MFDILDEMLLELWVAATPAKIALTIVGLILLVVCVVMIFMVI